MFSVLEPVLAPVHLLFSNAQCHSVPFVDVLPVHVVVVSVLLVFPGLSAPSLVVEFLQIYVVTNFALLVSFAVPIRLFCVVICFELRLVSVVHCVVVFLLGYVVHVNNSVAWTRFIFVLACRIDKVRFLFILVEYTECPILNKVLLLVDL